MRSLKRSIVVLLVTSASCAPTPLPCTTPGTCGSGRECLANRCVPVGSDPVDLSARRYVALPTRMAVVGSSTRSRRDLPGAVRFGAANDPSAALYLRFAPVWANARHIDGAFILLEPMPDSSGSPHDVAVTALRIEEDWDALTISRLQRPRVGLPRSPAIARASPPSALRIDVTEIVRHEHAHPGNAYGIAVLPRSTSGLGAAFSTGNSAGSPPRLEIYLRP